MAKAELVVFFLLCISAVHAADHVVGGTNGWQEILIDYTEWAAGEKFVAGDKLIFNYDLTHNVVEVDKDAYDSCVVPSDTPSYTGGETTINLTLPGSRYFICSISDHCTDGGMKLPITVEADSTGGSSPPAPSPSGTPPSDISPSPSPSGTPPSDIPPSPSPESGPPSDIPPSPSPESGPSDVPSPSPSTDSTSDLVPPTPSPSLIPPPSDLPPTPPPPPPSAGTFIILNPVLIGFSLILATLFAFMG